MPDDDTDARIAKREAQVAERLRRRSSSRVREIHNAGGGLPDVFVEGHAVREIRRTERARPDLTDYRGHERITVANLEDDEDDA